MYDVVKTVKASGERVVSGTYNTESAANGAAASVRAIVRQNGNAQFIKVTVEKRK